MIALPIVLAVALAAVLYLLAAARARERELQSRLATRDAESVELRAQLELAREQVTAAEASRARLEALDENQRATFAALAQQTLRANSEQFLQLARESLGALNESARGDLDKRQQAIAEMVKPVRDSLEKVDGKIHELEKVRAGAYAALTTQVRALLTETGNLSKALRAPSVRGRWGEMQLQRVVE